MWSRALYSKVKTNHFVSVSEISFNVAIVWRKINKIGREASVANVCHIVHLYFNLTFWKICDSLGCLPPTGYSLFVVFFFLLLQCFDDHFGFVELWPGFKRAWRHPNSFIEPNEQSNPEHDKSPEQEKNVYLGLTLTRCQFA